MNSGSSLDLHSELRVQVLSPKPGAPLIRVLGEGEAKVPRDKRNLVYQCIVRVFKEAHRPVPALELFCINRIPLARGLGSSSAAIVAGLLAGNRLLGDKLSREQILNWATDEEGHADNVASALYGGVRTNLIVDGKVTSLAWPVPALSCVVAIPAFELATKKARAVLPKKIPMRDVVANLAAVSVLAQAFAGRTDLLKDVLNDRLHEPYRAKLIPGFYGVKKAALTAGALGVTLSGAGPTIISFVKPSQTAKVGRAMVGAFARAGVKSRSLVLRIDKKGALVR
jgi:homoserine kinase